MVFILVWTFFLPNTSDRDDLEASQYRIWKQIYILRNILLVFNTRIKLQLKLASFFLQV